MCAPESASAERAVAEAPLLSDVIEALPIGIAVFDDAAALLRFNPTFVSMNAALAGILRPGLDWAMMLRVWHGRGVLSRRDQDRRAALEAALREGIEPLPIEIEGTPGRCFEIALRATRGDGFVMVQSDTSLRRRSEQTQKEAEELLRNVLEACPANVIMSRVADGQILYRSPAATELLGTARSTHDHFARREERADFVTALLPMGRVDDMPVTGVRADGTRFPCLVSARLIDCRGDDVVVSSTVDISKEIAPRKTLAEQREQIFLAEKMSAQRLTCRQHRPIDIGIVALDLRGLEPTGADDLRKTAGIVPIGLVRHHLQNPARVAGVHADNRQLPLRQRVPEPDGQRPGLHADPFEAFGSFRQPVDNCVRAGRYLRLGHLRPILTHHADRRLLLRHVQRCKHTHRILRAQAPARGRSD